MGVSKKLGVVFLPEFHLNLEQWPVRCALELISTVGSQTSSRGPAAVGPRIRFALFYVDMTYWLIQVVGRLNSLKLPKGAEILPLKFKSKRSPILSDFITSTKSTKKCTSYTDLDHGCKKDSCSAYYLTMQICL